ncbi:MAG: DinB family protein [Chloroherpetonaceae bacterium]|nr:DinB family protein [Chloroherpetonaceae bacterium]MDW8437417.1 DinB family protein [Chloroherpetonaceae bacterium]
MAKAKNPFGDADERAFKSDIGRYASAPQKLELALEKLSDAKLRWKPNPKQWSIREIVLHLADSEVIAVARMNLVIASGDKPPTLAAYDQDLLAERLRYNAQDELLALSLFKALRKHQTAILKSLPDEAFEKFGLHEERGKLTLAELVAHSANHAEAHLRQIERVKEALKEMER